MFIDITSPNSTELSHKMISRPNLKNGRIKILLVPCVPLKHLSKFFFFKKKPSIHTKLSLKFGQLMKEKYHQYHNTGNIVNVNYIDIITCSFSSSCLPNNLVAFSGSRNKRRTLISRLNNDATTICPGEKTTNIYDLVLLMGNLQTLSWWSLTLHYIHVTTFTSYQKMFVNYFCWLDFIICKRSS